MGLVGRLVLGEANVPIDPEHGAFDVPADFRSEAGKADVELLDQLAHRRPDFLLVFVAVGLEPGLGVVLLEASKE